MRAVIRILLLFCLAIFVSVPVMAGVFLNIPGHFEVSGDRLVVPVQILHMGSDYPTALEANVRFDSKLLSLEELRPSSALLGFNKQVHSRLSQRGDLAELKIVIAGLNRSRLPAGLLCHLVFRRTGSGELKLPEFRELTAVDRNGHELRVHRLSQDEPDLLTVVGMDLAMRHRVLIEERSQRPVDLYLRRISSSSHSNILSDHLIRAGLLQPQRLTFEIPRSSSRGRLLVLMVEAGRDSSDREALISARELFLPGLSVRKSDESGRRR